MTKTIRSGFDLKSETNPSSGKPLRGLHYAQHGHAPLSGLCPTKKTARKAALKAS